MEMVARVALIYAVLMIALRIIGKREFGQLSPAELVTLLLIPEILTEVLTQGESSLTRGMVGSATVLSLVFGLSLLAYRSRRIGGWTDGEPVVLVQHGHLVPASMHRERITPDELLSEMHKSGLERMEQVKWAVLEPDGKISFITREAGEGSRQDDQDALTG